jgi:hypothetical protein
MSLKSLATKYREAKIVAREKVGARENKSESDHLKDGVKKIDEMRLGLRDLHKKLVAHVRAQQSEPISFLCESVGVLEFDIFFRAETAEEGALLTQAFASYAATCSENRMSSYLAGLVETASMLNQKIDEIKNNLVCLRCTLSV